MKRLGFTTPLIVLTLVGCPSDPTEEVPSCDPEVPNTICTVAGSGFNGYDIDADTTVLEALDAKLSLPQDTLTADDGTIYVLDWNNHRIRMLEEDGKLAWVAGRGELGGSLDDPGNGDFNHPTNIIFDASEENIYIAAWHNSKIRILNRATGMITDACGDGKRAYWGDDGPAASSSLDLPASIAWNPDGNLVIMDQANQVIRMVDESDTITRIAGQCIIDSAAPCAEGVDPVQCPMGPDMRVSGKFTCGDPMTECSKPCTPGYAGDDGPALEMRMAQPFGQSAWPAGRIVFDAEGNLYFADTGNHLIRMIGTDGIVRRVAGQPPMGADKQPGYEGDGGPAIDSKLNFPVDLAIAEDGTIYFTDVLNHCVRKIDPDGNIDTVAGQCGVEGFEGDGGAPEEALLNMPFGVELAGNKLIIADTGNSRIRTIVLE
jgi:DNA-binding beta-propeller fold protein YncE